MESNRTIQSDQEEVLTLKTVILKAQEFRKYLFSKWLLIVAGGIIGGGIGFAYAYMKKAAYMAELTFVLEDAQSSPLGAYAGIASQFGIDLGSGRGSGVFTGDNIIEFLKSRLMVEKTLLTPIDVNGKTMTIAEYYIQVNNLREKFDATPELKGVSYPAGQNRSDFSLAQDSLLQVFYTNVTKQNLAVAKPDKKLSFISVRCTAEDEVFAKVFTERLVKEATDFYVQTKTKRSAETVNKLQAKADSIEKLLNKKTYSVAASQDMNLNPARNLASVNTEVGMRDKMVLQTMYAEVVKNLEVSKMAMSQETPIIQIIDIPRFPLRKIKTGKLQSLIIGGFIGGFLMIGLFVGRKLYRDIMN